MNGNGADTCRAYRSITHPRPNGPHGSRWALLSPHAASWSRVHSLARARLGDPVSRWPITLHRWSSVAITCEWFSPSSRMRLIVGSTAAVVGPVDGRGPAGGPSAAVSAARAADAATAERNNRQVDGMARLRRTGLGGQNHTDRCRRPRPAVRGGRRATGRPPPWSADDGSGPSSTPGMLSVRRTAIASPVPGMDPYLEDPATWTGVHVAILAAAFEQLGPAVRPRHAVRFEERVFITGDDDPGYRPVAPDVRPVERDPAAPLRPFATSAGIAEPIRVTLAAADEVHERSLHVIDARDRSVVTVIELLSPTNKQPGSFGRASFLRKRRELLAGDAHWMKIDLLRDGLRTPRWPTCLTRSTASTCPAAACPGTRSSDRSG